ECAVRRVPDAVLAGDRATPAAVVARADLVGVRARLAHDVLDLRVEVHHLARARHEGAGASARPSRPAARRVLVDVHVSPARERHRDRGGEAHIGTESVHAGCGNTERATRHPTGSASDRMPGCAYATCLSARRCWMPWRLFGLLASRSEE